MKPVLRVMENAAGPAGADLAREERLLGEAAAGPLLFLYSWPQAVLVLGHGQRDDGPDLSVARELGIAVERRATGGTGVYHHDDLAAALALPAGHPWAAGIQPLYDRFTAVVAAALGDLGVAITRPPARAAATRPRPALCFADHAAETLLVDGRKAVGCSQARRREAVLVHAFLLFNRETAATARLFRMAEAEVAALIAPLPLTRESRPLLRRALAERFAGALGLEALPVPLD
jgi:lipoate-protein ligase A